VFFFLEKKGGGKELVTPPLSRGDNTALLCVMANRQHRFV